MNAIDAVADIVLQSKRLVVFTGAGMGNVLLEHFKEL